MAGAKIRSEKVVSRLEPLIHRAMIQSLGNQTQSDYIRSLVIADLKYKGLLTDSMLAELL